jgi:hypothetical protein
LFFGSPADAVFKTFLLGESAGRRTGSGIRQEADKFWNPLKLDNEKV